MFKSKLISLILTGVLVLSSVAVVFADNAATSTDQTTKSMGGLVTQNNVFTAPEIPTLVNGKEVLPGDRCTNSLSKATSTITGPYFTSFTVNSYSNVPKFRLIQSATYDNSKNPTIMNGTFTIAKSTAQNSEWSASTSVDFNAAIKAGIIAKINGTYSVKESRSANEALGQNTSISVQPYTKSTMSAYYQGCKSTGTLQYYMLANSIRVSYTATATQTVHYKALKLTYAAQVIN